jgi:transcription elongation GreA/GreB family factor
MEVEEMAVRDQTSFAHEESGPALVTREGRAWFQRRLDQLRNEELPRLRRYMETQEDDGLLREAYQRARAEMLELSAVLRQATELSEKRSAGIVQLGDELEIHSSDGLTERFRIVHPIEAPMDDQRISANAPLARAALGRRAGDVLHVRTPGGELEYRLLEWAADGMRRRMVVESTRL